MANLTVCINASWYSLTTAGSIDAVSGNDPIPSKETINEGLVLLGTGKVYGSSYPALFHIAQKLNYQWVMEKGDISTKHGYYTGVGGLCPLLRNGLKYGSGNLYSKTFKNAKAVGEPLPEHLPYLIQRNDNRYASMATKGVRSGKAGIGFNPLGHVVIIAQQDGTNGVSLDEFRDMFVRKGCNNACLVDGNDSVFLWYSGGFKFKSAENKDETQITGIGIRVE